MSPKRILIVITCMLVLLTIVMAGIVIHRLAPLLQATLPSTEQPPVTTTTDATTLPTESTPPVTTEATEPGHQHEFTKLIRRVETTCIRDGYSIYLCECGQSANLDHEKAFGHSYEPSQADPTCTVDGYIGEKCANCGDIQKDTTIPATGHSYEPSQAEATCTVDGYIGKTCTTCGYIKKETTFPATGHSFGEWAVDPLDSTKECRTCTTCAEAETRDIVTETEPTEPGVDPSAPVESTEPSHPTEGSEPTGGSEPTESTAPPETTP